MSDRQVQIVLDYPHLPYRPGDTLTGHISAPPGGDFNHCEVSLLGVASVVAYSVKHDIASQEVAMLVSQSREVTPLSSTPSKFEIAIPSTTMDTENVFKVKPRLFKRNQPLLTQDARERMAKAKVSLQWFERESGHFLPPTLPLAYVGTFAINRGEIFAYIEYMVTVKALKRNESQELVPVAEHAVPFWFTSNCPAEEQIQSQIGGKERVTEQRTFTIRSTSLLSEAQLKARPVSNVLKMKLMSSAVPCFVWNATCSGPVHAHVGDSLVFQLDLVPASDHTTTGPLVTKMPDIVVYRFQVDLVRCIRAHSTKLYTFETNIAGGQILTTARALPYQESESKYERLIVEADPRLLSHRVIPDFKTFNLCINYRLKLSIKFVVAGEVVDWTYVLPIKILPRRNPPMDPVAVDGSVKAQRNLNEDWGECPGPLVSSKSSLMGLISRIDISDLAGGAASLATGVLGLATM